MLQKYGSPEPIDTEQDKEQRKTAAKNWTAEDAKALAEEAKGEKLEPEEG
jgi:hypothetical protein